MRQTMTTILLAAAAASISIVNSASAADMPVKYKAPPPPVVTCTWCGFYAGINGGGAWFDDGSAIVNETQNGVRFTQGTWPGTGNFGALRGSGGFGGGQIGYNWQRTQWVFGVEADIEGAGIRGSTAATLPYIVAPNTVTVGVTERIDWFGTVRGRLGYAWNSFLLYGTGGFAYGDVRTNIAYSDTLGFSALGANTSTRAGYVVGAGGEWAIAPQWSVKLEYQYINLGHQTTNAVEFLAGAPTAFAVNTTTRDDFHTVRVGVNYKWGGPIVAKY
jgi:outer membrane immunogenic protein